MLVSGSITVGVGGGDSVSVGVVSPVGGGNVGIVVRGTLNSTYH